MNQGTPGLINIVKSKLFGYGVQILKNVAKEMGTGSEI